MVSMSIDEEVGLTPEIIELYILNKLYTSSEYYNVIADNFDRRFYTNNNIVILNKLIIQYVSKYDKRPSVETLGYIIDKISANSKSLDDKALKLTLANAIKLPNTDDTFLKDNILQYIKGKAIYNVIMDELDNIQNEGSVDGCVDRFQEISKISFDDDLGMNYFEDFDAHCEYLMNPGAKLETGFRDLDKAFNGGVPADGRSLIVWAGRANIGKSLFLSNLAVNLIQQGKNVVVISLEMSEDMYASRFDAHISSIDINTLSEDIDTLKTRVSAFSTKYGGTLFIKEYPPNSVNCNNIKNYLDKLTINGNKLDAIIIDYINLLNPNSATDNSSDSYHRIGCVCKQMRAMSYSYEVPVFSVTQFNRSAVDTTQLDQSMVSESDQVNATVDALIGIYQEDDDMQNGIIRNTIMKSRFGMIGGSLEYNIDYSTLRITNIVNDNQDVDIDLTPSKISLSDEILNEL